MKQQLVGRLRPPTFLRTAAIVAGWIVACCIAACGGEDSTGMMATPIPGPPQGDGVLSPGYAYIASTNQSGTAGAIYQYAIAADGSLTPLAVVSVPAGVDPASIIADPTGHFVYVADRSDATISQFAVGTGGVLTPLSPATISLFSLPISPSGTILPTERIKLSVDPAGPHLYVIASGPSGLDLSVVFQFSIGPDGALTPLDAAYVNETFDASGALAIDPTGAHAYLVGTDWTAGCASCANENGIVQFAIGPDGALTAFAGPPVPVPEGFGVVESIVTAPSGVAYVLSQCVDTNCDGSIAPYAIASTGEVTPAGAATLTGSHVDPVDLVVDGSGTAAYLLAGLMGVDTDFGAVYQYSIDSTGAFSQMPTSFRLNGGAVAESRYGPNLYVLSGLAGTAQVVPSVAIYSIGSQGELTAVGNTPIAASAPTDMALIATPQ